MKSTLSFVLFFIFSTIEIKVKASDPPLQKPQNCFSTKQEDCIFSSGKKNLQIQEDKVVLNLKENTVLERREKDNLEFISGTVWIQNQKPVQVRTLYGKLESANGEFWIIEKENKILFRSIIGTLNIHLNSDVLRIPEGFQIWISGKNNLGKNIYGVPEVVPMETHLKLWAELFTGTREEFKEKVSLLKNLYKDNRNESGEFYQKIVDRHVASFEARKNVEKIAEQKRRVQLQEIRRLYFEKVFER
ncbi:MAG: hypothetical protein AABY64_08730 [Bdellovibrionota bacterium]